MAKIIEVECRVTQECYYGNKGEDARRYSPDIRGRDTVLYRGPEKPMPSYLEPIGKVRVLSDDDAAKAAVPKRPKAPTNTFVSQGNNDARIRLALESLDVDNSGHWTKGGEPALDAVEEFGGFEAKAISRSDVQNAWPEFNRDFARDYKPAQGRG